MSAISRSSFPIQDVACVCIGLGCLKILTLNGRLRFLQVRPLSMKGIIFTGVNAILGTSLGRTVSHYLKRGVDGRYTSGSREEKMCHLAIFTASVATSALLLNYYASKSIRQLGCASFAKKNVAASIFALTPIVLLEIGLNLFRKPPSTKPKSDSSPDFQPENGRFKDDQRQPIPLNSGDNSPDRDCGWDLVSDHPVSNEAKGDTKSSSNESDGEYGIPNLSEELPNSNQGTNNQYDIPKSLKSPHFNREAYN